ncbi:hypothetical protein [Aquimarina muelleri]|uniref:DUF5667 domain-containing protein n=1 Tax=Aquimarina muelleri TaxID=279356 RepID=A0A918N4C2_9FLAO|nr:hypothetical protein [Aquimarina muelleri]MCX2762864.1 hypothetical protein [Aquimarina muelleri]GGX26953.1 hypothetical protein GCM10007384_30160 [Aquimarina muelleri]
MKNNEIEKLFEGVKEKLDIHEPSTNHKVKFLEKLMQQNKVVQLHPKKTSWHKPLMIAASLTIIFGITATAFITNPKQEIDLAYVSPQMKETQSFFTSAIQVQLDEINKVSSKENRILVIDAMKQLKKLETDYNFLKKDLFQSGNDKRVISAMIKNFQKRANLLEEVLQKINDINEFKKINNENSIL